MVDWIYPYDRLNSPIELSVDRVLLDGTELDDAHLHVEIREARLLESDSPDWAHADIDVSVSVPTGALDEWGSDPKVLAVINCARSNSREAVELVEDSSDPTKWTATFKLERPTWFGRLDLSAWVVARTADVDNRMIGSCEPWTLRLDDVPAPPVGGAIARKWVNFKDDPEHPELKEMLSPLAAQATYLDLTTEPILYLNKGFEGLVAVLDDEGSRNHGQQALHDQVRTAIAAEVWWAMWWAALHSAEIDDGSGDISWAEDWHQTAAGTAARYLEGESSGEAIERVLQALNSPGTASDTASKLYNAAAKRVGANKRLRNSIELLLNNQPEDDPND
jgi:hypothetical protein